MNNKTRILLLLFVILLAIPLASAGSVGQAFALIIYLGVGTFLIAWGVVLFVKKTSRR